MERQTFENIILDRHADFSNRTFYKCTFRDVIFDEVEIWDSEFIECTFDNVRFAHCSIEWVTFENCIGIETISGIGSGNWVAHCEGLDDVPLVCPKDGEFYAYKAVLDIDSNSIGIAKLRIPENAKRSSGLGRKCRCSRAEVIDIWARDDKSVHWDMARSSYCPMFLYAVGRFAEPIGDEFDEDRWDECSSGIHFFMTEEEAEAYSYTLKNPA